MFPSQDKPEESKGFMLVGTKKPVTKDVPGHKSLSKENVLLLAQQSAPTVVSASASAGATSIGGKSEKKKAETVQKEEASLGIGYFLGEKQATKEVSQLFVKYQNYVCGIGTRGQ